MDMYRKYKEIIHYLVFGGLTTVINFLIYYTCVFTVLDPNNSVELQVANVLGWIGAVLFAYITNRKYVFESQQNTVMEEMPKFIGSRLFMLLVEMLLMFLLVSVLQFNDKVIKLLVQIIVIVSNYAFSKWIVFNEKGSRV